MPKSPYFFIIKPIIKNLNPLDKIDKITKSKKLNLE